MTDTAALDTELTDAELAFDRAADADDTDAMVEQFTAVAAIARRLLVELDIERSEDGAHAASRRLRER